ncbi:pilin [Sphaerisporangium sp. B11E5]|uniref:pilin n=1 Tax=Sphaerisporangium sp. B11E5 TaxID=3153563 RepID=UPI00325EFD44
MSTEIRRATPAQRSPLDIAEQAFRLLCCEPGGLALDATGLAGELPQRPVLLTELRELLMDRRLGNHVRDIVWRELVTRARAEGAPWLVAAVGMAIPALRRVAGRITTGYAAGDPADIDSEVLAVFIEAIRTLDLDGGNVRPRLCDAARRAGRRARRIAEAESVGRTRLEDQPLHQVAGELGLSTEAAKKRRQRSEPVLVAAVLSGQVCAAVSPTITSAAPRRVEVTTTVQRRSSSDANPDHRDPKGGPGTTSGSARPPATPAAPLPLWQRPAVRVLIIAVLTAALIAVAATTVFAATGELAAPPTNPDQLDKVLNNLRTWLIGLLAALATLMFTIGGVRYLIAGGDPGEIQKAKIAFKAAALGYALALLAPLFVNVLKRVVGG